MINANGGIKVIDDYILQKRGKNHLKKYESACYRWLWVCGTKYL